jgi:hypothetical protein
MVATLYNAVGLRALDPGGAVLDLLELQETVRRGAGRADRRICGRYRKAQVDLGGASLEGRDAVALQARLARAHSRVPQRFCDAQRAKWIHKLVTIARRKRGGGQAFLMG